jgi:signal peptidase II
LLKILKSRIAAFAWAAIAAVLIGIDGLTKALVVNNIKFNESHEWIKIGERELINLTHIHNDGAAFGILSGRQALLITVTGLFLLFAVGVLFSGRFKSKWLNAAIMLIIAGGVGNLIDRASQGYVVDFIQLRFIDFAIFNFADMCAVVGAFILAIAVISDEIREYRVKKACEVIEDDKA